MWLYSCYRKRNGTEILQGKKIVYSGEVQPLSILLRANEKIKNAKTIVMSNDHIRADDKKYYYKSRGGVMELYVGPVKYIMEEVEEYKNKTRIIEKILKFFKK